MAPVKLLVAIYVTLAIATTARAACDCEALTLEEQRDGADVIFRGELRAISEDVHGTGTGSWNYAMEALRVYQGEVSERISVRSEPPGGCGIDLERQGEYLVYADRVNDYREYESSRCMGTKPIAEAGADLSLLGDGYSPEPLSCRGAPPGALVWLVFVALRSRALRGRRG